jgi:hypothetical protein
LAMSTNIEPANDATFMGIPIGRLGLLPRLLMSGACGFIAFFIAFLFGILGFVIYDSMTGASMNNLDRAYLDVGAPAGIVVLIASLLFLLGGWARQKVSASR